MWLREDLPFQTQNNGASWIDPWSLYSSSHDNTRLASCGGDRSVFLWDVGTAATVKRFSGHNARVNAVAFNEESSILASGASCTLNRTPVNAQTLNFVWLLGSFDASVRLWDLKSQQSKPIQVLEDAKDSITSLLVADSYILSGCVDGHVRTYDIRNGQLVSDFFERMCIVALLPL